MGIGSRIICSPFPLAEDQENAYFFHRKTAVTNQNIFRTLKHVFWKSEYCSTEFLHSRKLTQFPESTTLSRKKQSLHHEKEHHRVIRWIFLLKFLYGWDFPSSHKVHTDQGKTLLRRLCVHWGLPLKSHECLQKKSVFNTKYHG